tara:strand:- start:102 stop:398 length:297 start_codon:yes stop_codon:yes gene_type:complete
LTNIGETIIVLIIAFGIGYIDDVTGPQTYYYKDTIVTVYEKYQCPTYCAIDHHHYVSIDSINTNGMYVCESELGKKYKEEKKKAKQLPQTMVAYDIEE